MKKYLRISMMLLTLLLCCCSRQEQETMRSMYYWSTTFALDSLKRDFIKAHGVERLYVRYFDVVLDKDSQSVPNATILFDSIAGSPCEIVPTVFIHNDCMRKDTPELPAKLLKRVLQMSQTHECGAVRELQIDCDWTKTTQDNFFRFLRRLKEEMRKAENQAIMLTATIRLHQLSMPVPPVDKGVLMVYNTGDLTRLDVEKPILDYKAVEPYLKYLKSYALPLCAAYPVFRWELVFRGGRFVDIMHRDDEIPLMQGDSIVVRQPAAADILQSKRAIEALREECGREIILFDLNNHNIKRYTHEDFENFFD